MSVACAVEPNAVVRLPLIALMKYRHAMHARVIFLNGWFEMVTNACIFVKEKEHPVSKDSDENIVQWRVNKTLPIYLKSIQTFYVVYYH